MSICASDSSPIISDAQSIVVTDSEMLPSEDDYWVGPTIGEGAFGHVVYAVHKATEQKVAIKVMEVPNTKQGNLHRQLQQQQKTQMILNERRILNLPAIKSSRWTIDLWAAFLGKPSSTQCLYFVMKLATGGDLAGLIKRGLESSCQPLWRQHSVPYYASQLIQAVEFLHSQGILHCDLKPENLLLDATTGNLMVADFGCSLDTSLPLEQNLSFPRGTALYAAPEVLRAVDDLTVTVDYWSVGCILHAMMFGSSPFDRGSEALTVEAIVGYDGNFKEWKKENALTGTSDNDNPIDQLVGDLLVIDIEDRIAAWKDKALSFLNSIDDGEVGTKKDILLPVPEWQEQVNNSTLRDGSLGWLVFQI